MRRELKELSDVELLAICIWAEARGEPEEGQIAVGFVVKHRVEHPTWWGNSYQTVINKPYQFSWTRMVDPNYEKVMQITDSIPGHYLNMAEKIIHGDIEDPVPGATHYYADYIAKPKWAKSMTLVSHIGHHLFLHP